MCLQIMQEQGQVEILASKDKPNEKRIVYNEKTKEVEMKEEPKKLTKQELIEEFITLVKNIENLPEQAMGTYVNHADLYHYMALLSSILRSD